MIIKSTKPISSIHVYIDGEDADSEIYINEMKPYRDSNYICLSFDEAEKISTVLSECIMTLRKRQEQ